MMNKEEIKLTEYLHNIIENNMSLRKENDRLWKQKLEYIEKISKAIEYIKTTVVMSDGTKLKDITDGIELLEILGGKE